jgi:hypothetical protein
MGGVTGCGPNKWILNYLQRATQTPQAPDRPEIKDMSDKRLASNGLDVPTYGVLPPETRIYYYHIDPLHLARNGELYCQLYPRSGYAVSPSQK